MATWNLNEYCWSRSEWAGDLLPVEPPSSMDTNEQGKEAPVSMETPWPQKSFSIVIFRKNIYLNSFLIQMFGSKADDFLLLLLQSSNDWCSAKFTFCYLVTSLKYTTSHKTIHWKHMFTREVKNPSNRLPFPKALRPEQGGLSSCYRIRPLECVVHMVLLCS